MDQRLIPLGRALDYQFRNAEILDAALLHPSARARNAPIDFQRLEFLGDRVLGLVVADMLYQHFPSESEGALARRHTALVRGEALARIAREWAIDAVLQMAKTDEGDGRATPSMLADACEAVLGAIFADGGLEPAARIIRRYWTPLMAEQNAPPRDAKTALQEWAQGRGKPLPIYELLSSDGPAHEPNFQVSVKIAGEEPAHGTGRSKRAAEQNAATALLERLAQ